MNFGVIAQLRFDATESQLKAALRKCSSPGQKAGQNKQS